MLKRKDDVVAQNTKGIEFLFKKNKITWAKGRGTLKAGNVVEVAGADGKTRAYQAKNVIIATGSVPSRAALPQVRRGARALERRRAHDPAGPEAPLVIGGGVIGLELGSVWRRLGAKVTVVELTPTILPGNDDEIIKEADKIFRKQGLDIRVGTKVTGAQVERRQRARRHREGRQDRDARGRLRARLRRTQAVAQRHRRRGARPRASASAARSSSTTRCAPTFRTSTPSATRSAASCSRTRPRKKASIAAEVIAGHKAHMHYKSMPSVVYTWPEIATVGLAEHEVKASGREYKTGKFPFSANGRARTMGETHGLREVHRRRRDRRAARRHMIGPNVSELIQEVVLAFEYRGSSEDIGITVHSHPTLCEAVKEAALGVLGRSLHI